MIIKKYQGKNEAEATNYAKAELGSNVVILNVKEIKPSGILRVFKPSMVEVTAAIEEGGQQKSFAAIQEKNVTNRSFIASSPIDKASKYDEKAIEEKLDSLQNLLENQLRQEKEETSIEKPAKEKNEIVLFMQMLYNTLLENEVIEKYANEIISEIEKNPKGKVTVDSILGNIYQKLVLKFGEPNLITPSEKGPKLIFLIGPTGVGKTTTIAKIASKLHIDNKKPIALLTADTYRIAATDQLRTYANILGVPIKVVFSANEIADAIEEFHDCEYILVDTAGHSPYNEEQKSDMKKFIHCADDKVEKEVFLVLSATTKYRDLAQIVDSYANIVDYKLIFTKIDETTTLGNILNIKLHTNADLSYITCGQSVPDDIEVINAQKIVKQLLGGK